MNILLIRHRHTRWAIDGELRIAGQKVCDTIEHPQHHLAAGTYPIRIDRCHQYGRKMPLVMVEANSINTIDAANSIHHKPYTINHTPYTINLPCMVCRKKRIRSEFANLPCYCPQIKMGHGVANRTDGSILVGQRQLSGFLLHSTDCFDRLIDRFKKAVTRDDTITLTIKG